MSLRDTAIDAAGKHMYDAAVGNIDRFPPWPELTEGERDVWRNEAESITDAILAAIGGDNDAASDVPAGAAQLG